MSGSSHRHPDPDLHQARQARAAERVLALGMCKVLMKPGPPLGLARCRARRKVSLAGWAASRSCLPLVAVRTRMRGRHARRFTGRAVEHRSEHRRRRRARCAAPKPERRRRSGNELGRRGSQAKGATSQLLATSVSTGPGSAAAWGGHSRAREQVGAGRAVVPPRPQAALPAAWRTGQPGGQRAYAARLARPSTGTELSLRA